MIVTVFDETISGNKTNVKTINLSNERLTAKDILKERLQLEVAMFNAQQDSCFQGLVQPEQSTQTKNGFQMKTKRFIDWSKQYEKAIASFEKNGFVMLVNDKQIIDLDEELEFSEGMEVSFMRLTPLVGG
jgi:thiamine kinase-like enzyme